MSGFNRGVFDLTSFNVGWGEKKRLTENNDSGFHAVVSITEAHRLHTAAEAVMGTDALRMGLGRFMAFTHSELVNGTANGQTELRWKEASEESAGGEAEMSVILRPPTELAETLDGATEYAVKLCAPETASEIMAGETDVAQKAFLKTEAFLTFTASSVDAEATEETICEIAVNLAPGDVLTIDAANYNVYINNGNAIHLQSGEWIDTVSRLTREVVVSTDDLNASMSVAVTYTERYL